jgi:hypothetical protein
MTDGIDQLRGIHEGHSRKDARQPMTT